MCLWEIVRSKADSDPEQKKYTTASVLKYPTNTGKKDDDDIAVLKSLRGPWNDEPL